MNEWSVADRAIRRSVDAYIIHSVRVGASIQEQLNHLQMTLPSEGDKGGVSTL